jgi:hypothetical protein
MMNNGETGEDLPAEPVFQFVLFHGRMKAVGHEDFHFGFLGIPMDMSRSSRGVSRPAGASAGCDHRK